MLKKYSFLIFLVTLLLTSILSCEKSTKNEGPKNDPEAIEALVNYYSTIFKEDVFDTIKDTTFSPVFYREIKKRDYFIKIDFADAPPETIYTKVANVTFTDSIQGIFHLFMNQKEYVDTFKAFSEVKGYFEKWGQDFDDFRGWFLKKVAGNKIYSIPSISANIRLHLKSSSGEDILFPSEIIGLTKIREVRSLGVGDSLTLKISNPDTLKVYFLHYRRNGDYRKRPFVAEGDTLFSGCKISGSGYQHLFIDILDHDTVYDSTAAYKSYAWGILFKVE
jgi:hypothetical protein